MCLQAASFAGAKRKVSGEFIASRPSLDVHSSMNHPTSINDTISGSDTGASTREEDTDDEVCKGSKAGRKPGELCNPLHPGIMADAIALL